MSASQRLVIGLEKAVTAEQATIMRDRLKGLMPEVEAVFVVGASFAEWQRDNDDLIVTATRMHEALYMNGEWMDAGPEHVIRAFGDLQQALKRRGWTA